MMSISVHKSIWHRVLAREILNRNYQIARAVAFELNQSLESTRQILGTMAKYPDVRKLGGTSVLESVLRTLKQMNNVFEAVYVVDRHGNLLVNVTKAPEAFNDVTSAVWYRNVVQGTYSNYTSDPYISRATGNPSITMAVLVRGALFKVEAVLAAEVNLTNMWELLKPIKVGQTGYAYVVDQKGQVIFHPISDRLNKEDELYKRIHDHVLEKKESAGKYLVSDGIEEQLVACYPLKEFNELRALPWTVVVVQPLDEVYTEGRARSVLMIDIIMIIASVILGVATATYSLRKFF